jgi:hypothetical protein
MAALPSDDRQAIARALPALRALLAALDVKSSPKE